MAAEVVLGLDVGEKRIGVALGRTDTKMASPLLTLISDGLVFESIRQLVAQHDAGSVIVGWPRGMSGQETAQTQFVEDFVTELQKAVKVPVRLQDEALTSQKAEKELQARKKPYDKADIDKLAATYIVEDYLNDDGLPSHV